jgi:hypothetical protein
MNVKEDKFSVDMFKTVKVRKYIYLLDELQFKKVRSCHNVGADKRIIS